MAKHFKINVFSNTTEQERELIATHAGQGPWQNGMDKLLERYSQETEKKLNELSNDHDTDLMCKTIIKTIEFIRDIPYSINEELKKLKRKKEEEA